jgi:hypothetical protein
MTNNCSINLFVNREIIHHRSSTLIVNGTSFDTSVAIGNAWTDYFETLSKASNSGKFDGIYKSLVETDLQNLRKLYGNSKSTVKFTSAEKVSKIFVTMKNRKAPDELSLVAEHFRNGGPIVCYILEKLFNKIYEEGHIPDVFKCGIITPVYKKHGKPIDDPNSYRRITVCSVIGKIFEKLVQAKIIDKLDSKQSKLQRGFTKGVPPTNAGLLLTEAIAEALDDNFPLYFVFIDASKAFDVAWHASLLRRIHEAGIQDPDWKIIDEWYKLAKCYGSREKPECVLCKDGDEDRNHFIL